MNMKKYFLLVLLAAFPVQVRADTANIFIGSVLAAGTTYTVFESKKAFKETKKKSVSPQIKKLWNGLQQRKWNDIKEGTIGIGEKAKPFLLVGYAVCTGILAVCFLSSELLS